MFPKTTFVTGGAASGKSLWAENFVTASGRPATYLATAQALDDEMRAKVARHAARRGAGWDLLEEPLDAAAALARLEEGRICLLDCATMWLSNHMAAGSDLAAAQPVLLAAIENCRAALVIVSNEVGQGIVPDNPLARRFREAQGRLNIELAARADLVVQVTVGLPLVLRGALP